MNSQKIDYDKISQTYDRRYEQNALSQIAEELKKKLNIKENSSLLDVGCGTAYWLNFFANETSYLFGADLSLGMLRKASERNKHIKLVQASAGFLPFKPNSIDSIFCINALHFFDTDNFIIECSKLLKLNGNIILVVLDLQNPESTWYAYDYFEGIKEFDYNRFNSVENIVSKLKKNNFIDIRTKIVQVVEDIFNNEEVFKDPFLSKMESSTLAWLTDEEYADGLNKIKQTVSETIKRKEKITFTKKFHFVLISAQS